ncbi:hypothetical protein LCGC14_3033120, partial [marine sediment metagenome]
NITFKVQGRKVRDPRGGTQYDNNSALCVADYLTNTSFGLGIPEADIDDTLLTVAANECDENVTITGGDPHDRYDCDGSFTVDRTPQDVLEELVASMAGYVVYVEGKWKIYAGAYRTPTETLDENELRGPMEIRSLISKTENFNAVRGVHKSSAEQYQPTDYVPVQNATYAAEDGETVWRDIALPFTPNPTRAQRLAKIFLERVRQPMIVEVKAKLSAFRLQPGEVVMMDNTRLGWSGKPFEVMSGALGLDNDGALGFDITLRETGASVYDWNLGEETIVDPEPQSALPNAFLAVAPSSVLLQSGGDQLFLREDGTIFSRIKVSWTFTQQAFMTNGGKIEIQFRQSPSSLSSVSIDTPT